MDVLIVEDDDSIAEPLARGLERERLRPRRVATGAAALAALPADVVLLDLGLPDMDGRDVCRRLREVSDVPIIVVSARGRNSTGSCCSNSAPTTTSSNRSGCRSSWRASVR